MSSRPLDLYRALALPFSGDQEFCKSLANFIAQQRQFQPSLLSPVQASAVRVLHAFIHNLPTREGFVLSELTSEINLDLASCGEPSGLKERKVGDVLTSLGLTNRSRRNIGYVLWVGRCDRVRIHEMARNYEVDGIPTDPIPNCEICTKKEHRVGNETPKPEVAEEKRVRSYEPIRERREQGEYLSGGGTRPTKGLR